MALVICPHCSAQVEEGPVCEYCGNNIISTKTIKPQSLKHDKAEKRDKVDKESTVFIYESNLTFEEVIESAKQFVRNDLKTNLRGRTKEDYEEIIAPTDDSVNMFTYNVECFELPFYWYKCEAKNKKTQKVEWFSFIAIADKNKSIPDVVLSELRFEQFNDFESKLKLTLKETVKNQNRYENLFNIDKKEIWDSLYAKNKRDNYFYIHEEPIIKQIIIPIYVVTIKVKSSIGKGVKDVYRQYILKSDGEIQEASKNFHHLIAEYLFGDDWSSIIKDRSLQRRLEKNQRRLEKKAEVDARYRKYIRKANIKFCIGVLLVVVGIVIGVVGACLDSTYYGALIGGLVITTLLMGIGFKMLAS